MSERVSVILDKAEKAALVAAVEAMIHLIGQDLDAAVYISVNLAFDMSKAARRDAEQGIEALYFQRFHYEEAESLFFSNGWRGDTSVDAFAELAGLVAAYRAFCDTAIEAALESMVETGELIRSEDGESYIITELGRKAVEEKREG